MFGFRSFRSWKGPLALAGMGAVGFALGAWDSGATPAVAQTPAGPVVPAAGTASDYGQRVVAYIHGNVPITREELGEYLIARQGATKVELLVNRRIIEHACKVKGITVTDAEVDAAIDEERRPNGLDKAAFVKEILRRRGLSLYEYKEDVVRSGLMLKKLCQNEVKVEEEELKKAFDARYGEKVECKLILWKEDSMRIALQQWQKFRQDEKEFDSAAASQADSQLAAVGGRIEPIARGVASNPLVENIAFRLKPGQVSEIFPVKDIGCIGVLRCEGRIPPVADVTLEQKRAELHKEVFDKKVLLAIREKALKLREEAKPVILIPHGTNNPPAVRNNEDVQKILKEEKPVPLPGQAEKPNK